MSNFCVVPEVITAMVVEDRATGLRSDFGGGRAGT